ncbi:hypothetical protein Tco_0776174 [Tanacetum coccineum]
MSWIRCGCVGELSVERELCQSSQQQANMLLRFKRLYEDSDKLQESCDLAQTKYVGCKKKLADLQVAFNAKVSYYGQLLHDYEDALRREEALKVKVVELETGKKESDEVVVFCRLERHQRFRAAGKLFEMHYPYVDKVTRAYLLDPSELQNVMPEGAGPTPGGGPRPSSTAHS